MAQQVASGNLNARAPVWGRDEIGELAVAINTMTDHLVSTQEDLARKNRGLAAINQIVMAAEQQNDIHDALYTMILGSSSTCCTYGLGGFTCGILKGAFITLRAGMAWMMSWRHIS
jgi:hypothetical protein